MLTGLNGSGKSHLMSAIKTGNVRIDEPAGLNINTDVLQTSYRDMKLEPVRNHNVEAEWKRRQEILRLRNELRDQVAPSRDQILAKYGVPASARKGRSISSLPNAVIDSVPEEQRPQLRAELETLARNQAGNFAPVFGGNNAANQATIQTMQERLGKPLIDATEGDIRWNLPAHIPQVDLLNNAFSEQFGTYVKLREQNAYHIFRNERYGEENIVLTDEGFISVQGEPPWNLANQVFGAAGIPARFDDPPEFIETTFAAVLRHTKSDDVLNFTDLSSGEQVLATLALSVYGRATHGQSMRLPKVLLLDEFDAPLHPSMIQRLLDTIESVFVRDHGMHVVLATHSPTTVALAPESSIYEMSADEPRLAKATKARALSLLSTGIPTLSVRVDARRPTFVESDNDVLFYEGIHGSLSAELSDTPFSPQFLSTSRRPGSGDLTGCERVIAIVEKLSETGVEQIRGLVDGDGRESELPPAVLALGSGRRYGIENYVLDPLLVGLFLVKMQFLSKVSLDDLGLPTSSDAWGGVVESEISSLQAVVDGVLAAVATPSGADESRIESALVGGQKVELPSWVLEMQGHKWEGLLKKTFPELQRFHNEPDLKTQVISHVIRAKPQLLSLEVLDSLVDLSS